MTSITQVRLWNDTGYTDGCLEIPISQTPPSASFTYTGSFAVASDKMFSEIKIKDYYTKLMNVSYIAISLDTNYTDQTFYGWVDSVEMISDGSAPLTRITWHIDHWRTYGLSSAVSYGSGMVKRRPASDTMPPQNYPYRFKKVNSMIKIMDMSTWFVYLFRTVTVGTEQGVGSTTLARWNVFPVNLNSPTSRMSVGSGQGPSLQDTMRGQIDELFKFNPDSVKFAFISPIPPAPYSGGSMTGWSAQSVDGSSYYFFSNNGGNSDFQDIKGSIGVSDPSLYSSDDTTDIVLTGLNGEIIGSFPWGLKMEGTYYARVVCDASSACLLVSFVPTNGGVFGTDAPTNTMFANTVGLSFTIPLPAIDITENAWSSYVYSGARQAQIDTRMLQAQSQLVSGGTSALTSAVSGGAMGAMAGGPIGALAGAIGGSATQLISTGINYAYQTGAYNDEMTRIEDYQRSQQANGLLVVGGGWNCVWNRLHSCALVRLEIDDYAKTQRANDLAVYGASVSEPSADCTSVIKAGGPLQIQNLTVKGAIPSEAKNYIRRRFAQGVIIK